jgi:hypothetical protein
MQQFRIVTDGSCDLPAEWCKEHHIAVIPLYFSLASAAPPTLPLPYHKGSLFMPINR